MTMAPGDREPRSMAIDQQDRQALPSGSGESTTSVDVGRRIIHVECRRWRRSDRLLRRMDAEGLKKGIGYMPMETKWMWVPSVNGTIDGIVWRSTNGRSASCRWMERADVEDRFEGSHHHVEWAQMEISVKDRRPTRRIRGSVRVYRIDDAVRVCRCKEDLNLNEWRPWVCAGNKRKKDPWECTGSPSKKRPVECVPGIEELTNEWRRLRPHLQTSHNNKQG